MTKKEKRKHEVRLEDFFVKDNKIINLDKEEIIFEIPGYGKFEVDNRPLEVKRTGDVYLLGLHIGCLSRSAMIKFKKNKAAKPA